MWTKRERERACISHSVADDDDNGRQIPRWDVEIRDQPCICMHIQLERFEREKKTKAHRNCLEIRIEKSRHIMGTRGQ